MIRSASGPISPPRGALPMPMLPARHYESEHTRFIRELKEKKPRLGAEQRESRAIWWDKRPQDLAERKKMDEGRVAQAAYVYRSGD
jgi:hypothetical protein